MDQLSQIVAQSMARHGCGSDIDHRRLNWSPWIRCQWNDRLLDLPSAAGILALAEDVGSLGSPEESNRIDGAPFKPQVGVSGEVDGAPFKPSFGLSGEATTEQDSHSPRPTGDLQPNPAAQRRQNLLPHVSAGEEKAHDASPLQGTAPADNAPRVLALFEIAETDDLGSAIVRLFGPHSGYRDRLRSGRCFVRFTPVTDAAQRQSAARALREWLHNSAADDATPAATENNEKITAA